MLCAVKRLVGLGGHHQAVGIVAQLHQAGAEGAPQVLRLGRVVNFGKAPTDFIQHLAGRFAVGVGHDNGELFTTVTGRHIGGTAAAGAQGFCDATQRIITRHILPNVAGPILVILTINIALAVITEAAAKPG